MTSRSKLYTVHKILDGRWQVEITFEEDPTRFEFLPGPRPELKELVSKNYEMEPQALAKIISETVFGVRRVEVTRLWGPTIVIVV